MTSSTWRTVESPPVQRSRSTSSRSHSTATVAPAGALDVAGSALAAGVTSMTFVRTARRAAESTSIGADGTEQLVAPIQPHPPDEVVAYTDAYGDTNTTSGCKRRGRRCAPWCAAASTGRPL